MSRSLLSSLSPMHLHSSHSNSSASSSTIIDTENDTPPFIILPFPSSSSSSSFHFPFSVLQWDSDRDLSTLLSFVVLFLGIVFLFRGTRHSRLLLLSLPSLLSSYSTFIAFSSFHVFESSPTLRYIFVFASALAGMISSAVVKDIGILSVGVAVGGIFSLLTYSFSFLFLFGNRNVENPINENSEWIIRTLFLISSSLFFSLLSIFALRRLIKIFTSFLGSFFIVSSINNLLSPPIFSSLPTIPFSSFSIELFVFYSDPHYFQCPSFLTWYSTLYKPYQSNNYLNHVPHTTHEAIIHMITWCYSLLSIWILLFIAGIAMQWGQKFPSYSSVTSKTFSGRGRNGSANNMMGGKSSGHGYGFGYGSGLSTIGREEKGSEIGKSKPKNNVPLPAYSDSSDSELLPRGVSSKEKQKIYDEMIEEERRSQSQSSSSSSSSSLSSMGKSLLNRFSPSSKQDAEKKLQREKAAEIAQKYGIDTNVKKTQQERNKLLEKYSYQKGEGAGTKSENEEEQA